MLASPWSPRPPHPDLLAAALAAAPIAFLFWALAVKGLRGHVTAALTLAVAFPVAILAFGMPPGLALLSALHGAAFGLWPIAWIVVTAVFLYELVVTTGELEVVKAALSAMTPDRRLQALVVAFAFGALLEGAAGFGTPVAIAGALLAALGFDAVDAATLALVANACAVPFGAVGIPVEVAGRISTVGVGPVSALVGRTLPLLSFAVPFLIAILVAGVRRGAEVWPACLAAGLAYAAAQGLAANLLGPALPDVLAALATLGALALLLRFWRPRTVFRFASDPPPSGAAPPAAARVLRAFSPFGLLALAVAIQALPAARAILDRATVVLPVPGLDRAVLHGGVPVRATVRLDLLAAAGTGVLAAALASAAALRARPREAARVLGRTAARLSFPILTIALVLAFAFLVNASGMAAAIGAVLARAGAAFPAVVPILGWVGVVATGSNTSSSALFAPLEAATAAHLGVAPVVAVTANVTGGACAQMISPQALAIAAAGVGVGGRETRVLRRTLWRSLLLLAGAATLATLQAGPLAAAVPGPVAAAVGEARPGTAAGLAALAAGAIVAAFLVALARRAGAREPGPARGEELPTGPAELP